MTTFHCFFSVTVLRGPAAVRASIKDSFTHSFAHSSVAGFPNASDMLKGCGLVERSDQNNSVSDFASAWRLVHNVSITIAGSNEFETRVLSATHSVTHEPVVILISVMQ